MSDIKHLELNLNNCNTNYNHINDHLPFWQDIFKPFH